jgi:hypothetical protein
MSAWYFKDDGAVAVSSPGQSYAAISADRVELPSAVDLNGVYNCTLYNSPYKGLSLSFPPSTITYVLLGSVLMLFAAAQLPKKQEEGDDKVHLQQGDSSGDSAADQKAIHDQHYPRRMTSNVEIV